MSPSSFPAFLTIHHLYRLLNARLSSYSDWRLGQMIANLAMTAGRMEPGGVWDLEDAEALRAAATLIRQYSAATVNSRNRESIL